MINSHVCIWVDALPARQTHEIFGNLKRETEVILSAIEIAGMKLAFGQMAVSVAEPVERFGSTFGSNPLLANFDRLAIVPQFRIPVSALRLHIAQTEVQIHERSWMTLLTAQGHVLR